jgi:hypothetical protein
MDLMHWVLPALLIAAVFLALSVWGAFGDAKPSDPGPSH